MAASPAPKRKTPAKQAKRPMLPDRQAMENYAASHTQAEIDAALHDAQNLIYDAWEQTTARATVSLARKALAICPLCADAFNILTDQAKDPEERLALCTLAMAAGELGLGPRRFAELSGEFWGWLETRPYMRARNFLALTLLELGRGAEAAEHLRAMLTLNPNDNQGNRYLLHDFLLNADDITGLKKLLRAYKGEWSPRWLYTRALLAYRDGKAETAATRKLISEAVECNGHVIGLLSGAEKPVPESALVAVSSPEEAAEYVQYCGAAWARVPGAVEWLTRIGNEGRPNPRKAARAG
jgi:tetratricopeptide (TPR) repeat protein